MTSDELEKCSMQEIECEGCGEKLNVVVMEDKEFKGNRLCSECLVSLIV